MTPPYYKALMTYAPQPVPHWRLTLRKAWSIRFIALFAIAQGMEAIWPSLADSLEPHLYNGLAFVLAVLAFLSVFVKQDGFPYFSRKGVPQ
jgi:hypothetical protein